jgi:hypothetical protein
MNLDEVARLTTTNTNKKQRIICDIELDPMQDLQQQTLNKNNKLNATLNLAQCKICNNKH